MSEKVDLVGVTASMREAGLDRYRELLGQSEQDEGYIVSAVYMAMEYERLDCTGQLSCVGDHRGKVRQP